MDHRKKKYQAGGITYNDQFEVPGKLLSVPIYSGIGYATGVRLADGLGLDQRTQRRFGRMSALNAGLSSTATLLQTIRRRQEQRDREDMVLRDDYVRLPYDQYAYDSFSNSQFDGNFLQDGGEVPVSMDGLYEYPEQPVVVPSPNITMQDINYDVLGVPDKGMPQIMEPNKDYYFEGADNVLELPMLNYGGRKKYQDGGVFDATPVEEAVIFDATPVRDQDIEVEPINPFSPGLGFPSQVSPNYNNPNAPKGGTIAVSHNNPGNIKMGKYAEQYGATPGRSATDGGVFAVFPDVDTGLKAQRDLLLGKNYRDLTVNQAMKRWSNQGYGAEIYPSVSGKLMKDLTETELMELQKRQIRREDHSMYKLIYDA